MTVEFMDVVIVDGASVEAFQRALDSLPKQGSRPPWCCNQSYWQDRKLLLREPVDDGVPQFS